VLLIKPNELTGVSFCQKDWNFIKVVALLSCFRSTKFIEQSCQLHKDSLSPKLKISKKGKNGQNRNKSETVNLKLEISTAF